MKANLIGLAILAIVAGAAILQANPARCYSCLQGGNPCWSAMNCGLNCQCLRINGPTEAGVCG